LLSTFTSTLSGNPFAIDFEKSKIIIFLVSSIFVTIVIGTMYYSRVDMMNRRKSMYTKDDKKKYKHEIESSKDNFNNNNNNNNNVGDVFNNLDIYSNVSTTYDNNDDGNNNNLKVKDDDDLLLLDVNTRMNVINKIIEKDFIDKVFELEGFLSDEPLFSLFEKKKIEDDRDEEKDKEEEEEEEDEEIDLTPQLNGWISFWVQILASIFVDTLFFSTFFPDGGVCETFTTEATCIIPMNNAMNTPLCQWKAKKKVLNGGTCSLSPPPADVSFTFILVVLTVIVTIPIVIFLKRILHYAFLRPKLSLWGWNEEYWLGKIR